MSSLLNFSIYSFSLNSPFGELITYLQQKDDSIKIKQDTSILKKDWWKEFGIQASLGKFVILFSVILRFLLLVLYLFFFYNLDIDKVVLGHRHLLIRSTSSLSRALKHLCYLMLTRAFHLKLVGLAFLNHLTALGKPVL